MNRWNWFLSILALTCGAGFLGIYAFGSSRSYCTHSQGFADLAPCYKYDVGNTDADVVLVGDSSLLYAIRPALVRQRSGISTYNYGLVGPAFGFDPTAVIDHYLARNRRPRAIVVYFSPWDRIEPGRINDEQWFPAALLTLQHGGIVDFLRLFRARPLAIVEIPAIITRSVGLSTAFATAGRAAMEADDGHLDYAGMTNPDQASLEGQCRPPTRAPPIEVSTRSQRALSELRRHYGAMGIALYVYVAPSAECDRAIGTIRARFAGIADNQPVALPDRFFVREGAREHVHVNGEGVVATSDLLAQFLIDKVAAGTAR